MDYRIITIIGGVIMAVSGLAYAFSIQDGHYLDALKYGYDVTLSRYTIWIIWPRFLTGIIVAIGGIAVSIIGAIYFRKRSNNVKV